MDANNTPYFLLRTEDELRQGSSRMEWHPEHRALMLRQKQPLRLPATQPDALAQWQATTPMAVDHHYQVAVLNDERDTVLCHGGQGWETLDHDTGTHFSCPPDCRYTDMVINGNGRLALPYTDSDNTHGLTLFHLGKRWLSDCRLPEEPVRGNVDRNGGIWIASVNSLMYCEGQPLPAAYAADDSRFEPEIINPTPLKCAWQQPLPDGWSPLALCSDNESLHVLLHDGAGKQRIISRSLSERASMPFYAYALDERCPFVIDIACVSKDRFALLAPKESDDINFTQPDCPVVRLEPDTDNLVGTARLLFERYPMIGLAEPRFASSADGQVRYQAPEDPDYPGLSPRPRELHALRQPRYEDNASALLREVLDSGTPGTVWHRVYIDACIPAGCNVEIAARVYDDADARGQADIHMQPQPVWNPLPSEHPFQSALSGHESGRRGVFEVLLQRPEGTVRNLEGRYLQLQLHLTGSGRKTPSVHAIRVYSPRFSYQEAYLPEVFRQEESPTAENASGPANGADVRERLLASFESILTPLEGRVAAADRLLHPATAPDANLNWLALSVGESLPSHWPKARQRRWLEHATLMQQRKGSLPALNLALDIVTDGGVQNGSVVVIENFRLRRTMATLLGINMDDSDHPLTLGTGISGNSIVGDSLILSEMNAREFLALFAPDLAAGQATEDDREAVREFFDKYAHQVSILLHGLAQKQRQEVESLLAQQLPAHLKWHIIETDQPFILGNAPLLGVDTWLEQQPDHRQVTLGETHLGRTDLLMNPLAFLPSNIHQRMS